MSHTRELAARPTTPPVLAALFCGAPHPLDPTVLCAVIGCRGEHSSDGQDAWTTPTNDDENGLSNHG